jgi:putative ABC transport system permease protein
MKLKSFLKSTFIANYQIKLVGYFGLIISFTALLFGITFYKNETSYENFHSNADRLYRLTLKAENFTNDAQVLTINSKKILSNIPEIENIIRIHRLHTPAVVTDTKIYTNELIFSADSSFFTTFSFTFKRGNSGSLYSKPDAVILTSEFAKRLFGSDNVLGRTLKLTTSDISVAKLYTVTGILNDIPFNSHITASAFILIPKVEYGNYTYLLLNKNVSPKVVERKLDVFYKTPCYATLQNIQFPFN